MPPMVISLTASIMCSQRSSIEIRPHLSQCGEEKMDEVEWMDMEVAAKMQVFLYVHKIRKEMLAEQAFLSLPFPEGKPEETNDEEEEKEEEDGDGDLEEDFNDIVQQLL